MFNLVIEGGFDSDWNLKKNIIIMFEDTGMVGRVLLSIGWKWYSSEGGRNAFHICSRSTAAIGFRGLCYCCYSIGGI